MLWLLSTFPPVITVDLDVGCVQSFPSGQLDGGHDSMPTSSDMQLGSANETKLRYHETGHLKVIELRYT